MRPLDFPSGDSCAAVGDKFASVRAFDRTSAQVSAQVAISGGELKIGIQDEYVDWISINLEFLNPYESLEKPLSTIKVGIYLRKSRRESKKLHNRVSRSTKEDFK